jgi:hypothetical protein
LQIELKYVQGNVHDGIGEQPAFAFCVIFWRVLEISSFFITLLSVSPSEDIGVHVLIIFFIEDIGSAPVGT